MDIIDKVSYDWLWDDEKDLSEATRRAYVELFSIGNPDALLVMRHLIGLCKWMDMSEYNDPIVEAKMNSLRSIIRVIKQQLNMKEIEEIVYE